MISGPYTVTIVVDREFGDLLAELSRDMHVWVCDTPSNRAAAERIWGDHPRYDLESGVTTFTFRDEALAAEMVVAVLGDVDLHHGEYSHEPPWSVIKVVGCASDSDLVAAFASYGAALVTTDPAAFEARREFRAEAK
jgi:hypothetical protein